MKEYAFPHPEQQGEWSDEQGNRYEDQRGMTLRDWFAGQAITGLCSFYESTSDAKEGDAALAYVAFAMADEMMYCRDMKPKTITEWLSRHLEWSDESETDS